VLVAAAPARTLRRDSVWRAIGTFVKSSVVAAVVRV
jgi:hypothetical protein